MSNVPYLIEKARFGGYRYGNGKMVDCLVHDGLWDPYGDHHMGICAEKYCARAGALQFSLSICVSAYLSVCLPAHSKLTHAHTCC